jgi:hypothetical protein
MVVSDLGFKTMVLKKTPNTHSRFKACLFAQHALRMCLELWLSWQQTFSIQ